MSTHEIHALSGAYAVDALDPEERARFEEHLAACAECQAEEVTQEVFLQVWRTASRFDEDKGSPLAWLMTLAHRRSVDRVRSAEAVSRQDTSYHQNNHVVAHDSTAEEAEKSMEARRVRAALDELTPVQREALELAYFGGYTHAEVAVMLDLPVGTAKTRIRDGLIRMRDAIGVSQ